MERSDFIPRLELEHVLAHGRDVPRDIIAVVPVDTLGKSEPGILPVLGVATGHDHLDENLAGSRLGDVNVVDTRLELVVHHCFLHSDGAVIVVYGSSEGEYRLYSAV